MHTRAGLLAMMGVIACGGLASQEGDNGGETGDGGLDEEEFLCGNGVQETREQCDDGDANGTYGHCARDCGVGPFCGDGLITGPEEECDLSAAGSDSTTCNSSCTALEFTINTTTQAQFEPQIAALPSGFVVAYVTGAAGGSDVRFRRLRESGIPASSDDQPANTIVDGTQYRPAVAGFSDGGFVIAWEHYTSVFSTFIHHRRFAPDGAAIDAVDVSMSSASGSRNTPSLTAYMTPSGERYAASWMFYNQSFFQAEARAFARNGTPIGTNWIVGGTKPMIYPQITAFGTGSKIIVGWGSGNVGTDIFARRFDAGDVAIDGSEFPVNSSVAGEQGYPDVACTDVSGESVCLVVWTDAQTHTVRGRRFGASGATLDSADFSIGEQPNAASSRPAVAALDDGSFAVAWTKGNGLSGRRISNEGIVDGASEAPVSAEALIAPQNAEFGAGPAGLLLCWTNNVPNLSPAIRCRLWRAHSSFP